jgi:ABC-type lipoprotein export system ATPase subunit
MLLELEHIGKEYAAPDGGMPLTILKDISLSVQRGESISIVGPSGSGKSTLLNIIGTLDKPTSGSVKLDGQDLATLSDTKLASVRNRKIGFVFQLHHLLPQCSVIENVMIPTVPVGGDSAEARKRAERLLEKVGLANRLHHRPAQLSGGESQRVAVVRALINKPVLLLADEPTGSLDHSSAENLGKLLVELNAEENVALILVTHSQELATRASRRFTLSDALLRE